MPTRTQFFKKIPWSGGLNSAVDPGVLPDGDLVTADNVVFGTSGSRLRREGFSYFDLESAIPTVSYRWSTGTTRTLVFLTELTTTSPVNNRLVAGERVNVTTSATSGNEYTYYLTSTATIAASEDVNARYTTAAGQSIGTSGAVVVWGTKDFDSHGGMNTSTGVYTCQLSGRYRVTGSVHYASAAMTAGSGKSVGIFKNGAVQSYSGVVPSANVTAGFFVQSSDTVRCLAGDTLSIWTHANEAAAKSLTADSAYNYVTIERIGNY